ncbi:toll/interleukin-1 receptor domain-containing protein [Burkholderia anthina]|uniref:toll/interleukin-1 receptor domain-containing protein n=1 Tax=Burkholderia anthina TaxID=179879 RepID=UPI00158DEEF5|nr:toll/interleukin-1 receptor domain-containing protein [Burkholderia anthina]
MEAGNRKPYYNLLMSGSADAWAGPSWAMEYDRVFEHTHGEVKKQFETLDDAALQALMELPTLFAYEKYIGAPARVGRLTEIMRQQREFSFTFTFDSAIAPIPHDAFMGLLHALDIDPKWEINRTHWAVKNVDLGRVLHASGLAATSLVASLRRPPKVFISYSWDSPEHRVWVAQLATSLRRDGIEAILDQWYVKLGEDLAAFMAINVRECDRVLVICTEEYVRKARERKGGRRLRANAGHWPNDARCWNHEVHPCRPTVEQSVYAARRVGGTALRGSLRWPWPARCVSALGP